LEIFVNKLILSNGLAKAVSYWLPASYDVNIDFPVGEFQSIFLKMNLFCFGKSCQRPAASG
jgi:hypothetical protein